MSGPSTKSVIRAFGLDLLVVVIFALGGRASHGQDLGSGIWRTLWPFLLALLAAWALTLGWRAPIAPVRTGLPVSVITVAGGMLLRSATGQGTQPMFVVVTTALLIALFVGWRVFANLARNRRTL